MQISIAELCSAPAGGVADSIQWDKIQRLLYLVEQARLCKRVGHQLSVHIWQSDI